MNARLVLEVLKRPSLWIIAITQFLAFVPTGWWRTKPFLPLPRESYLEFRTKTVFGGQAEAAKLGANGPLVGADDANPSSGLAEIDESSAYMDYLYWCKELRRRRGR